MRDGIIPAEKINLPADIARFYAGNRRVDGAASGERAAYDGEVWFHGKRIDNPNTHGTGCTLSSAIASNLAKGRDLETSVRYAKNYISGALAAMLDLGKGSGPMNHAFAVEGEYKG